jgi:uncharacterized protein (TIGR02453 family)
MQHFSPDFAQFFKDLAAHNDRDWFHANKKRYEQSVKKPFEAFVQELIDLLRTVDKGVDIAPKDAIFRIHRDTRFSADKTPYKLNAGAIVSSGGKSDHLKPGLYVELGPEKLAVYGGIYMPDKDQLAAIRGHIAANLKKFDALLDHADFKRVFGTVHGERNKVLPKELKDAAAKQPILFNKSFYYYAHLPAEDLTRPDLARTMFDMHLAGRPMGDFLYQPLAKK